MMNEEAHDTPSIAALPPLPESTTTTNAPSPSSSSPPSPSLQTSEHTADRTVATLSNAWQFDDLQVSCHDCRAEFTPLNRRHHCRLCGKIFCHECSRHRALIPPSSIVLVPSGGKKAKPRSAVDDAAMASFSPDQDPDRMLTYMAAGGSNELLYGKGLEERFKLAREPLRACRPCAQQLAPLQEDLRNTNSNAVRFNYIDPTDGRRLWNSPVAFTLGHEIRKAAYTLNNLLPMPKRMGVVVGYSSSSTSNTTTNNGMYNINNNNNSLFAIQENDASELQQCKENCSTVSPTLGDLDGVRIPARLLEQAKGVAVMTVAKGGFGIAGVEFGSGLAVARLDGNRWSAPTAIGVTGLSWGALVGAQVADHVFLLMTDSAVEMLFDNGGSVQLGADVGVALGPLGRSLEADFGAAPGNVAPIYTYSMSKGFYAGVSLDGKVIFTRNRVNEKFYGRQVRGREILQGAVPTPPAAQPLYEALTRCHVYATGSLPSRPALHQRSALAAPAPVHQPNDHNETDAEYGETLDDAPMSPPALSNSHSYSGMSDITSEPGF